jgi:eukaryotic-like serine/threonine-protein kinase
MADETRHYGAGPAPPSPVASSPALAQTEIAPTLASSSAHMPVATQPFELAPGTEVGEYVVGRKLGEGGMGAVYAGQHPVIGKRVAIKVLAPHCSANPELVRRFLDEARAVNLIHHPHIVDIFAFGDLPGQRPYFVMEYLDGESMAEAIERNRLRPDEIRRLLRQICSALVATHQVGIVHRDLKPENIWIARPAHGDSYVKLLDFGIAKLADPTRTNLTQTGAVMGTPLYMSPEQCMGRPVDLRTDIYAMGVLLFRIFTGRHPFVGTVTTELALKHLIEPPPVPSTIQPLPPDVDRLILDCLAKEPERRPADAQILCTRIEQALDAWPEHRLASSLPVKNDGEAAVFARLSFPDARPATVVVPRRRPLAWVLAGLLVLAAGAGGAWLFLRAPKGEPSRAAEITPSPQQPMSLPPTPAAVPQPSPAVPSSQRALDDAKIAPPHPGRSRPGPKAPARALPEPAEAHPIPAKKTAEAEAQASEPAPRPEPIPSAAPAPHPTRAQERGLLDENPLRR